MTEVPLRAAQEQRLRLRIARSRVFFIVEDVVEFVFEDLWSAVERVIDQLCGDGVAEETESRASGDQEDRVLDELAEVRLEKNDKAWDGDAEEEGSDAAAKSAFAVFRRGGEEEGHGGGKECTDKRHHRPPDSGAQIIGSRIAGDDPGSCYSRDGCSCNEDEFCAMVEHQAEG